MDGFGLAYGRVYSRLGRAVRVWLLTRRVLTSGCWTLWMRAFTVKVLRGEVSEENRRLISPWCVLLGVLYTCILR